MYKRLDHEMKQSYCAHHEILTDGSQSCDEVSAACIFIQSNILRRVNPPSSTSIFTAELVVIKLALTNICKTKYKQHILFLILSLHYKHISSTYMIAYFTFYCCPMIYVIVILTLFSAEFQAM